MCGASSSPGRRRQWRSMVWAPTILVLAAAPGVGVTRAAAAAPGTGRPVGIAKGAAAKAGLDSKGLKVNLDLTPDPKDPHENGFVPREPGVGGIWAWGKTHATMHHVMENAPKGNPAAVADTLDAFSTEYGLPFVVGNTMGAILDSAVRAAISGSLQQSRQAASAAAAAGAASRSGDDAADDANDDDTSGAVGFRMLAIRPSVGTRLVRCLPALLENPPEEDGWHEIVGLEPDWHRSDASQQIMIHALGDDWGKQIRHTPLIPAEDTKLPEVLDTLRTGYGVRAFHFVILESNDRSQQEEQLMTLLTAGALHPGAVVIAEGPSGDDPGTQQYMDRFTNSRHGQFEHQVRTMNATSAAVVSTLRSRGDGEL